MRIPHGLSTGTAALFVSLACAPATAQVTFKAFAEFCIVTGMSADGSVAVGAYDDGTTNDVFRWTASGGVELIGASPKQAQYNDISISRDGKTIVGSVPDSQGRFNAAIWQGGKNWRILNPFTGAVASDLGVVSLATGVSADGSVIVGQAYVSGTKAVAFRWDALNGMVNLGTFDQADTSDSSAVAVSGDGRNIIGWDFKLGFSPAGPGGGAMGQRRGAIWWDGRERLMHPFGWAGEAFATNYDGSIIVGQFHPMNTNNLVHGASTYLWTAWDGHFEDLGAVAIPIGGNQLNYVSQPYAVSDDGSVVGGDTGAQQKSAMIWTRQTGIINVSDFLTMNGITEHRSWVSLDRTAYISPDGHTVVGHGHTPPGGTSPFPWPRTWIMTIH